MAIFFHQPSGKGTNPPGHKTNRVSDAKPSSFSLRFLDTDDLFSIPCACRQAPRLDQWVLSDPRESRLPDIGLITLEDAERRGEIALQPADAQGYQTAAKERNERPLRA